MQCEGVTRSGARCSRLGARFCSQHAAGEFVGSGSLLDAVGRMVDSFGDRLTGDHAPFVVGLQVLSADIDAGRADDKVWREWRLLLTELSRIVRTDDSEDSHLEGLFDRFSNLGNPTDG